ncbi:MAG: hypothetical protein AAF664_10490 [Planctomycetota bacterium]
MSENLPSEDAPPPEPNHEVPKDDLQTRIDGSIKRQFQPPSEPDLSFLKEFRSEAKTESLFKEERVAAVTSDRARSEWSRTRLVLIAVAACLAWLIVGSQFYFGQRQKNQAVAFKPQPLTLAYRKCVQDGFKPYWICEDEAIFASTFRVRQGMAMNLIDLPDQYRMVGLSYLAGISRNSTSLLAEADGVPVVVFVDRLERDWHPPTGRFEDEGLSVSRSERDGLVFYEVSPLDEAVISPYLRPSLQVDVNGSNESPDNE